MYKRSLEESELREKQLTALRVDVCSTEALKRLKGDFLALPLYSPLLLKSAELNHYVYVFHLLYYFHSLSVSLKIRQGGTSFLKTLKKAA